MDDVGGRPTPGLDGAVALLAEGAEPSRVLREALRAALHASHAESAVIVEERRGRAGGAEGSAEIASLGAPHDTLRTAAFEALAGAPAKRSDPLEGTLAVGIPVVVAGRVLAALAVSGSPGTLDPGPLDGAAHVVGLVLAPRTGHSATQSLLSAFDATDCHDVDSLARCCADALSAATASPAMVCVADGDHVRVGAFRGLDRDRVAALVALPGFVAALAGWNESRTDHGALLVDTDDPSEQLACVPVTPNGFGGALVALVPVGDPADARSVLEDAARYVGARLAALGDAGRASGLRAELETVIGGLDTPVLVVDGSRNVRRANPAAAELFGLNGSLDSPRPLEDRLGNDDLHGLLFEGQGGEAEVTLGSPPRPYRASVRVTRTDDAGELRVLTLHDLSSLREGARLKDEFVSVMGHELRTPLTVIAGTLQTLRRQGHLLGDEDRTEILESAIRQTEMLGHMISDLLLVSTERRKKPVLTNSECDVGQIVEDVASSMRSKYPGRDMDILCLGGDPTATLDADRLSQVVRHLLDNALKHTSGPVRVDIGGDAGAIEISVTDQGPGIFSGDLERMFEPFVQLDGSSTRSAGGTGIGLHLARLLVEGMGGRLECDSRLGQGSRFSFRLPRVPTRAGDEPAETVAPTRKEPSDEVRH